MAIKETRFEFSEIPGFEGWKIRTKVWWVCKFKKNSSKAKEYEDIRAMLYTIYKVVDTIHSTKKLFKKPDRKSNYRYFTCMLFSVIQDLKTEGNINLPLPYYWYVHGVEIEWGSLDEIINKAGYQVEIDGIRGKDMSIETLQFIAEHNPV